MLFGKKKSKWSDYPGCFERHLQRRDGNLLFPANRRLIIQEEIIEAKKKDLFELEAIDFRLKTFLKGIRNFSLLGANEGGEALAEFQNILEQCASLGGTAFLRMLELQEEIENVMIAHLNSILPDGKEMLIKARALSAYLRVPYFAQLKRKDTPILPTEEIATILSEDIDMVNLISQYTHAFEIAPSDKEIDSYLENAIRTGFDKKTALKLSEAWHKN